VFKKYIVQGLMLDDNETLRLTPGGMLVSNEIFQEIVDGH
jgi:coproporphyrinogen III oxidase-like Fe-S oxidoreductase